MKEIEKREEKEIYEFKKKRIKEKKQEMNKWMKQSEKRKNKVVSEWISETKWVNERARDENKAKRKKMDL